MVDTEADAGLLRLVREGSRPFALVAGGSLTRSPEGGLRHDGGDAETGSGVEVGSNLRYASAWGLSIEASGRELLAPGPEVPANGAPAAPYLSVRITRAAAWRRP